MNFMLNGSVFILGIRLEMIAEPILKSIYDNLLLLVSIVLLTFSHSLAIRFVGICSPFTSSRSEDRKVGNTKGDAAADLSGVKGTVSMRLFF